MQSRAVYTAIMCLNNKFKRCVTQNIQNYVRILCIVIRNQKNQNELGRGERRNKKWRNKKVKVKKLDQKLLVEKSQFF